MSADGAAPYISASRDIPERIKREVRQRCAFGCVVCGLPLYDYEHMEGYAKVKRHVAKEITLLCDKHHREKTSGLLPLKDVVKADSEPFNRSSGVSSPYGLHFSGSTLKVIVGNNHFVANAQWGAVALSVDAIPLVKFTQTDGNVFLDVLAFDVNNNVALQIDQNSLQFSAEAWDIEFVAKRLMIRESKGNFLLDVTFDVPDTIRFNRGRFLCNGVDIEFDQEEIHVWNTGNAFRDCEFAAECCLAIGRLLPGVGTAFNLPNVPRYGIDLEAHRKVAAMAKARSP
jgi:hypothetical protein